MESVLIDLERKSVGFSEKAHKLFEQCGWTWFVLDGERIPTRDEIWGCLLSLIDEARREHRRSKSPWVAVSSGRLTVRLTAYEGRVHGRLSVEPISTI